jgi:hypothetical protein
VPFNPEHIPYIPELKMDLRARKAAWTKWTSRREEYGRNVGTHSCTQCGVVTLCAGERYDLLICWNCLFPEPELQNQSPLDIRRREREERLQRGEKQREVWRKPQQGKTKA